LLSRVAAVVAGHTQAVAGLAVSEPARDLVLLPGQIIPLPLAVVAQMLRQPMLEHQEATLYLALSPQRVVAAVDHIQTPLT
jgi:hypothetical protein